MVDSKALAFLLLPVLFFLGFSSFSDGAFPGVEGGDGKYNFVSSRIERSVLQVRRDGENSTLVLAGERTRRKDPRNDLKYYTGGWNISNEHYFYSVAYTAAPLFLIAAFWFIIFGVSILLTCFCFCCCRRRPYGYSRIAYAASLIFLSLFTLAAIVGCAVLYTGQGKFHETTTNTLHYVVSQAEFTVENLNNVSGYLAAAKGVGVDRVFLPQDVQSNIDKVDNMISSSAKTLDSETKKNSKDINDVLDAVRLALIVLAAVMLLLALLGFLFSILGLRFLVYFLVIIGWILVTVTFILCGIFLALHNVTEDTCIAMNDWVKNPTAHTAMDDILPCVDNATAQQTLSQSKDVTYQLIEIVNGIITNISNINPPPFIPILSYNQSGPLVPILCNPLNPDKTDRNCAAREVGLSNASQVWKSYICQVSQNNTCITVGRLTPSMYDQMAAAVNVSYGLNNYGPFLVGLLDCTFVRDTFNGISEDHCPDLNRYSKYIYVGLAMVSGAVMLSLIFWVIYARERRHRKYTKLADARGHK